MTDKKTTNEKTGFSSGISTFHLEANRSTRGMLLMFSGIIGVKDFSQEKIELLSHGCRVTIIGKRLIINAFENNNLEILGKVEDINFRYGKN